MHTVVEVHRDPSPVQSHSSSVARQSPSLSTHTTRLDSPRLGSDSSSYTVQSCSSSLPSQASDRSGSEEGSGCSTSPKQLIFPSRATSTPSCQAGQTEQPRQSSLRSGSFISYGESFDDLHQLTALREELKRKISETLSLSPIPSPRSLTPTTPSPKCETIAVQNTGPKTSPRPYASIYVNPLSDMDVCHSIESLDEPLRVSALEGPLNDSPALGHCTTLDAVGPWMEEEEPVYYNDYPGCTPPLEELQYVTCTESDLEIAARWQDLRESTV